MSRRAHQVLDRSIVRLGGWTPRHFNNLFIWVRPDSLGGFANNDPIGTWTDESGNARDLTSSGAARPTWVANAINGYGAPTFSGSQYLQSTNYTDLAQPYSFAFVARTGSVVTDNQQIDGGESGTLRGVPYQNTSQFNLYAGAVLSDTAVTLVANTWYYVVMRGDGTSSDIAVNNNTATSGNAGTQSHGRTNLGSDSTPGGLGWTGRIVEFCLYGDLLTTAERDQLEFYFVNKYAL